MVESALPVSPVSVDEDDLDEPGALTRTLRVRDFRLLVIGQSTSTVGDFLFIVAFPFLLLAGHTGAGGLGLALTLLGLTRIAGTVLGGGAADRWNPRAVMLGTDLARAVVLAALAAALAAGRPPLWLYLVAATVIGLLEGLFLPAYRAITPDLLDEADLAAGNAAGESLNTVAAILAQLVAGLLFAVLGASAVVGIDAGTFLVSAATLLAMRLRRDVSVRPADGSSSDDPSSGSVRPAAVPAGTSPGAPADGSHAFRSFALGSRLYLIITLMTGMVSITAAGLFAVGLPIMADDRFTAGAEIYGLLLVGIGAGRLGGSLAAARLASARLRGPLTLALLLVHGAVLITLPELHHLSLLLPALTVLGFADGTLLVLIVTVVQQLAPRALLGRAMGAVTFMQTGSFPISVALAGFAVGHWGLNTAFTAGGIGVLVVAALGATQRTVRRA